MSEQPTSTSTGYEVLGDLLFSPKSIALIGASADPLKASSRPLEYLRRDGFRGAIYPVNLHGSEIGGERAYPSLAALPEVPDHAFVMTPRAATVEAVRECGRAGVRLVTVLSGGFGEAGTEGEARERELRTTACEYGVRVLGPNSLGLVNTRNGLTLTANAAFAEAELPRGGLFVASHSGSLIGGLLSRGVARGLGFSKLVSVGGEVDLSLGEICGTAVDDPDVTGFLLFLESLRHADRIREFAAAAAIVGKPVVAYKLGRSAAAANLSVSHTGALAGEDDVAAAFLADCGIARVHTLDGLLETTPLVRRVAPRPAPQTGAPERKVGVVTTTGGGAAMVVDQLGLRGVDIAVPSEETLRRLIAAGAAAEPSLIIDLTLAGTRPEIMGSALDVLLTAPEFDLVIAVVGSSARFQPELAVAPIVERCFVGTPVAVFIVPDAAQAMAMLSDNDVPSFRTPESCADAIAAALARRQPRTPTIAHLAVDSPAYALDEADSYAVLRDIGVPVAPFSVLFVDVARRAAPLVGPRFPVVVKALSAELVHKSDIGGVVLNVRTPDELNRAATQIQQTVERHAPGTTVNEVLVQEMATGLGEVLVGYRIDPDAGPLVLIAAGGVFAELHEDRALRLAPVDLATADEMLEELRALRALRGFRGGPKGDLAALAALVVAMSLLAVQPEVVEAEINPVLVGVAGEGVVAVDAVVHTCRPRGDTA